MNSSITIGSNVAALQASRYIGRADSALLQSFTRLSSGMRINRASDDAAGLAISKLLDTDSRVLAQAVRNVNDGISALDIADGAVQELSNIVTRLGELAEQAANGTLSVAQRRPLQSEADQLVKEYERITSSTEFNNTRLLYNGQAAISVQSGYGSSNNLAVGIGSDLSRNDGSGSYTQIVSFTGAGNDSAAAGDFNGDGLADLAFTADTNMVVYLGNGNGTFAAPRTYADGGCMDIQTGDFNGDGVTDILTGSSTGYLRVFQGNGNGTFKAGVSINIGGGSGITTIEAGDFNNDGRDDVAAGVGASLRVYTATAAGLFSTSSSFTNSTFTPDHIEIADLNNDGNNDLVAKSAGEASARVFLGTGTGGFGSIATVAAGPDTTGISLADYNRDGKLDLFASENSGFSIALGNGNGTFAAKIIVASAAGASTVVEARDVTGDGILDFAESSGTIFIVNKGNADGSFSYIASSVNSGTRAGHLAIADLNQDGAMEVIAAGGASYEIAQAITSKSSTMSFLYLLSADGARDSLTLVDRAMDRISKERGVIGAYQERLTASYSVIQQNREQLLTAASSIQSADIAQEAANMVRNKILLQAGIAVLAQAERSPEIALTLLGVADS